MGKYLGGISFILCCLFAILGGVAYEFEYEFIGLSLYIVSLLFLGVVLMKCVE